MRIDWEKTSARVTPNGSSRDRWDAGVRTDPRWAHGYLTDHDLWYVWGGRGWINTRQGRIALRPGTCIWLRPGWFYEAGQDPDDPVGHDYIHFDLLDTRTGRRRAVSRPLPAELLQPFDPQLTAAVVARIVELNRGPLAVGSDARAAAQTADALMQGLLMDLDAASETVSSQASHGTRALHYRLMRQAASRIALDPAQTPPVSELAAAAGYSPAHFSRVFRGVFGKNPKSFALEARLDQAQYLLRRSEFSIKEISRRLGYKDADFFCRQFTQKLGLTPTQYRRQGD